ncbi:MAG: glutamate-5-semialdehyde dehydrogenase [Longicatena sp.]|nr:glutamate-5-semialdehyde dehydrogenase [Longicatena sp.]
MLTLQQLGQNAKKASRMIMNASSNEKNAILNTMAELLKAKTSEIIEANQKDLELAHINQMPANLIDRMMLDEKRINGIIEGIYQVIALDDPIGEISDMHLTKTGLQVGKMRVALGVVGMIYEARPNVSVDAAILCLKSGNAVILRGSKDILNSNLKLVEIMREALKAHAFDENIISLLEDTSHECANEFMRLNEYLDVLIPRGGAKLIASVVKNASVPVLETGTGNCHTYIDASADMEKAMNIVINAKTQRTSVCNACESILIHRGVRDADIKPIIQALIDKNVVIHGDMTICELHNEVIPATNEDYAREYLDLEVSIKMVKSVEEAIEHINHYSTHHSETIVSENYTNIKKFLKEVDSACVYANASTRFSDGFEFGLGAEIGISTQKLHARGPMGLKALTCEKYIILGNGEIRK